MKNGWEKKMKKMKKVTKWMTLLAVIAACAVVLVAYSVVGVRNEVTTNNIDNKDYLYPEETADISLDINVIPTFSEEIEDSNSLSVNKQYTVQILVENLSEEAVEDVAVRATCRWLDATQLRLIAEVTYGAGNSMVYAEEYLIATQEPIRMKETKVGLFDLDHNDLTASGSYWVGGKPIPLDSDGQLENGVANARILEYEMSFVSRDIASEPTP